MHMDALKTGRKIANLEKKLRTVPTGQIVLQYVLPFRAARIKMTTKVTDAMMKVGRLLIHTSLWANAYPPHFSAIHAQRLFPHIHTGEKRFCAIRPKELYGARSAANALTPRTMATMKTASIP